MKAPVKPSVTAPLGLPDPNDTNYWTTNVYTPVPWSGTTTFVLNTPTNNTLLTTTNGPTDTNHFYAIYEAADAGSPWTIRTNVIGGLPFALTDTNRTALFKAMQLPGFVVYGTPVTDGPAFTDCLEGDRVGYAEFVKPVPAWGWTPDTNNYSTFTMTDVLRNDTRIGYVSVIGQSGCGTSPQTITNLFMGAQPFRFAVYFGSNMPTNPYPLLLTGFNP